MSAGVSQKRKLEASNAAAKAKKRQKGETTGSSVGTTAVRGDSLKWKPVSLPDRLDDAQGFYELEEVEDVDVIRDERNHVMFRPRQSSGPVSNNDQDPESNEEGSWNGFEDDDTKSQLQEAITNGRSERDKLNSDATQPKSILKPEKANLDPSVNFSVLNATQSSHEPDLSAWQELDLSTEMLNAISSLGFSRPTTIQSAAVPPILKGQDVVGKAVTGSGKTLAFGIPILERWSSRASEVRGNPFALILAPTRELAHQLERHLTSLANGLDGHPRIAKVTGGLSILKQQRVLEHADIIIATPGRMWEVVNESHGLIERLSKIKFLVVDEADRLLSEGHFKEVEDILDLLGRNHINADGDVSEPSNHDRQTLVFSATFHKSLHQKLVGRLKTGNNLLSNEESLSYLLQKLPFRSKPLLIDSNPNHQMSEQLDETIVESPAMEKDLYLYTLILQNPTLKTLVFTNSISAVKRLALVLQNLTLPALAIHSSMPQKSRLRALERFTEHDTNNQRILVATDVAARGLDIKSIDLIVHYHVPRTADMYVHRSGRTARADASGRSILLCSPEEVVPTTRLIAKVHANGKTPQVVPVDHDIVRRLRPRVGLAQKIVEIQQAQETTNSKDNWLAKAAEELGVDYDSEEFEEESRKHFRGRGGDKARRLKASAQTTKADIARLRAKLVDLLSKKVNLGVHERYLAGGRVDVNALLDGKANGLFLEGR